MSVNVLSLASGELRVVCAVSPSDPDYSRWKAVAREAGRSWSLSRQWTDEEEKKHPRGEGGKWAKRGTAPAPVIDARRVDLDRGFDEELANWNFYDDDGHHFLQRVGLEHGVFDPSPDDPDAEPLDVWRWVNTQDGGATEHGDWTVDEAEAREKGEAFASDNDMEAPEPARADEEPSMEADPDWGSAAVINVLDRDDVTQAWEFLFGGDVPTGAAAALVGAPDDATVTLSMAATRSVKITVEHPKYTAERTIRHDRRLGGAYIENETFFLKDESERGGGLGVKVLAAQIEAARRAGVKALRCHAARSGTMNGYYTWPRFGYDEPLDTLDAAVRDAAQQAFPQAESVLDIMETEEAIFSPEELKRTNRILAIKDKDRGKTPRERAKITGAEWWLAHGDDMHNAEFDLSDGSRSMQVFEAYLEEKRRTGRTLSRAEDEERTENDRRRRTEEPDVSPDDEAALEAVWEARRKAQAGEAGEGLAEAYAALWNRLEALGLPPGDAELSLASEALAGGDWHVLERDGGGWEVCEITGAGEYDLARASHGPADFPWKRTQGGVNKWVRRVSGRLQYSKSENQPGSGRGTHAAPEPAPRPTPRGNLQQARERTQGLIQAAVQGGDFADEHLNDLVNGLQLLTVDQLREARRALGASFGGASRKDDMVAALRSHVRERLARPEPEPAPESEEKPKAPEPEAAPQAPEVADALPEGAVRVLTALQSGRFTSAEDFTEFAFSRLTRESAVALQRADALPGAESRRGLQPSQFIEQWSRAAWADAHPAPPPAPAPPAPTPAPSASAAPPPLTGNEPWMGILQGAMTAVQDGSVTGPNALHRRLQHLSRRDIRDMRPYDNLPLAAERARDHPDEIEWLGAFSDALWDSIPEHQRGATSPAPPATGAPAPAQPPAPAAVPTIQGKAEDAPTVPTSVRVRGDMAAATGLFGRAVDPQLLAAAANGYDGATTRVSRGYGGRISTETSAPGLTANRTFTKHPNGEIEVHNDLFLIADDGAYAGHGAAMFLNQVRSLRALGVDYITTLAAGDLREASTDGGFNGYITWPKFGYDGDLSRDQFDKLPQAMRDRMGASRSIQDLFALPGGEEAWELHGSYINLKFDLSDDSRSMKKLNAYLEKRRSRPERPGRGARPGTPGERMAARRAELERKIREAGS